MLNVNVTDNSTSLPDSFQRFNSLRVLFPQFGFAAGQLCKSK